MVPGSPAFAGVTKKARNAPPCVERGHIAHRSSVSVPFSPPPARQAGGTLFRAYRGRARARVGAGAVRAPDCPREAAGALPSWSALRVFRPVSPASRSRHRSLPSVRLGSVLPAAGSSGRRTLCRARIAGGRGRVSAPARFARLIARARQRAHLSRAFHRGFRKWRRPAMAAPEKRLRTPLLPASYQHHFPDVNPFQELFLKKENELPGRPFSALPKPAPGPRHASGALPCRAASDRMASHESKTLRCGADAP